MTYSLNIKETPQGETWHHPHKEKVWFLNKSLFSVNLQPGICWAGSQNQNESKFSCVLTTQDAELETTLGATRPVTEPKNQFKNEWIKPTGRVWSQLFNHVWLKRTNEPVQLFSCITEDLLSVGTSVVRSIGASVSSLYWNFKHVPGQLGTICRSSR